MVVDGGGGGASGVRSQLGEPWCGGGGVVGGAKASLDGGMMGVLWYGLEGDS